MPKRNNKKKNKGGNKKPLILLTAVVTIMLLIVVLLLSMEKYGITGKNLAAQYSQYVCNPPYEETHETDWVTVNGDVELRKMQYRESDIRRLAVDKMKTKFCENLQEEWKPKIGQEGSELKCTDSDCSAVQQTPRCEISEVTPDSVSHNTPTSAGYKKDDEGELILDSNDNPIPMVNVTYRGQLKARLWVTCSKEYTPSLSPFPSGTDWQDEVWYGGGEDRCGKKENDCNPDNEWDLGLHSTGEGEFSSSYLSPQSVAEEAKARARQNASDSDKIERLCKGADVLQITNEGRRIMDYELINNPCWREGCTPENNPPFTFTRYKLHRTDDEEGVGELECRYKTIPPESNNEGAVRYKAQCYGACFYKVACEPSESNSPSPDSSETPSLYPEYSETPSYY